MTKLFENAMKSIEPDDKARLSSIPSEYDLRLEDFTELAKMAMQGDPCYAIHYAFMYGFVMGNRATHSRKLRRL